MKRRCEYCRNTLVLMRKIFWVRSESGSKPWTNYLKPNAAVRFAPRTQAGTGRRGTSLTKELGARSWKIGGAKNSARRGYCYWENCFRPGFELHRAERETGVPASRPA